MNSTIFKIGPLSIKWYSVLILTGAILGLFLVIKEGKKFGYKSDELFDLGFWVIIFGILGAKIYYILFNLELYLDNPIDILKIWEPGLAIHGGIIAGLITMYIYTKKHKLSLIRITDFTVVGLIIAQAIGRWGNFFNMEAHGPATTLEVLQNLRIPEFIINGMKINGIYYHPTFLYESLWCLIGFIILLIIRRIKWIKIGLPTYFYLIWYGIGRFFIESLRTDSLMILGFKAAQLVSIIMIVIGIVGIMLSFKKSKYENLYNQQNNKELKM